MALSIQHFSWLDSTLWRSIQRKILLFGTERKNIEMALPVPKNATFPSSTLTKE